MATKSKFVSFPEKPSGRLAILGIIGVALLAGLWWNNVYLGAGNVFWGTLDNSLATTSVVAQTVQTSNGQTARGLVQLDTSGSGKARAVTVLMQGANKVITEDIGTRTADYTRYTSIISSEKTAQGKPVDTSKVIDVWAKNDTSQQTDGQTTGAELLPQALLGVGVPLGSVPMPIGGLTTTQRSSLMQAIQAGNVYQPDFGGVKKAWKGGRLYYTYSVKVQNIPYVHMMQLFGKDLGMHELDQVNPNDYLSAQPLSMTLTIDAVNRQLTSAMVNGTGYTSTYGPYGLPVNTSVPKTYITAAQLQQRLSQL